MVALNCLRNRLCYPVTAMIFAVVAVAWSGCDESVNPFIESDRYFSLFGTLDMNADTQWVRVVPIDTTIFTTRTDSIDAAMYSTDLNTGDVTMWRDSLFEFSDGSFGHVFYAPLKIQPNHIYRIEVERSDNVRTWAETTVPSRPEVTIADADRFVLSSGSVVVNQSIIWAGVERHPGSVAVWYRFNASSRGDFVDIQLPYSTTDFDAEPGWKIVVRLTDDRTIIADQIDLDGFSLLGIGMTVSLFDEGFTPPGGVFDPDILSRPGALSNVENGFGFVGSIGRFEAQWVLDDQTALDLGYKVPKR